MVLLLLALAALGQPSAGGASGANARLDARVTAVVDGDTIRVRTQGGHRHAVDLLGIDAPERVRAGMAECGAVQALHNLLQLTFTRPSDSDGDHFFDMGGGKGRRVVMSTDPARGSFEPGRPLSAYVRTLAGKQLQLDQLIRGWAKVRGAGRRFRRYHEFSRAQVDAQRASHGAWSKCGGDFHRPA